MKVKLDGRTIMCPQVQHDIFGNEFTFPDDFYGPSVFGDFWKDWYGTSLTYTHKYPDGSLFSGPWIVDVDEVVYSKGFKVSDFSGGINIAKTDR